MSSFVIANHNFLAAALDLFLYCLQVRAATATYFRPFMFEKENVKTRQIVFIGVVQGNVISTVANLY